jgi:hypothetical protein
VHGALGGGHYEAGLGPWSSRVRRSLKSIGSAASGWASELSKLTRVQELAVVLDLANEPVELRMAATGGGDVGSLHLGRERRRPETA